MPAMNEIINVSVSVSSTSVTRQGFNSILLVGDQTMVAGDLDTEFKVMAFTDATAAQAVCTGDLSDMVGVAFGQSPGVTTVYVSYVNNTETLETEDLNAILNNNADFFGYASVFNTEADRQTQLAWLATNKKFGAFLDHTAVLSTITKQSGANDSGVIFHTKTANDNPAQWTNVAWLSKVLGQTPGSYTGAFIQLNSVDASQYTKTEEDYLRDAGYNQYSVVGGIPMSWNGITTAQTVGHFADLYIGAVYLEVRLQEDLVNLLVNTPKVAYTSAGLNQVQSVINQRLEQSTTDGYLDPAVPYSVSMPNIEGVNRADRNLSGITFSATASGAIQSMEIQGTVDAT